jgi:hypothetical protein
MMSLMRTTLTLDDDLAKELREEARKSGRQFKEVVNDVLRRGLAAGVKPGRRPRRFRVQPKACGFRPGIDLTKLNQLVDEVEAERFGTSEVHDR